MFYDEVCRDFKNWGDSKEIDKFIGNSKVIKREELYEAKASAVKTAKKLFDATVVVMELDEDLMEKSNYEDLSQLATLPLPFKNMFLELLFQGRELGIHIHEYNTNEYIVEVYFKAKTGEITPLIVFIKKSKLPRYYFACGKDCPNRNISTEFTLLAKELCLRSQRNTSCEIANTVTDSLLILITCIKIINSPTKDMEFVKAPSPTKFKNNAGKRNKNNVVYIKRVRKVYTERNESSNRKSPEPHFRRGHYRHYKNGKVVWVNESKIGKPKKIYKIT